MTEIEISETENSGVVHVLPQGLLWLGECFACVRFCFSRCRFSVNNRSGWFSGFCF